MQLIEVDESRPRRGSNTTDMTEDDLLVHFIPARSISRHHWRSRVSSATRHGTSRLRPLKRMSLGRALHQSRRPQGDRGSLIC